MKHFQIQNLSQKDVDALNFLKEFLGERALSKAVLTAVDFYPNLKIQLASSREEVERLESELSSLRADIRTYFDIEKTLKSEGEKYS